MEWFAELFTEHKNLNYVELGTFASVILFWCLHDLQRLQLLYSTMRKTNICSLTEIQQCRQLLHESYTNDIDLCFAQLG